MPHSKQFGFVKKGCFVRGHVSLPVGQCGLQVGFLKSRVKQFVLKPEQTQSQKWDLLLVRI